MESVTVERTIEAPREAVEAAMREEARFVRAAGFDEVTASGSTITVTNRVGVVTIELQLERVETTDATLAYEQRDGPFESMRTVYRVESVPAGTRVEATTKFALDVAVVGDILDATVVSRQRRRELEAQLDALESAGGA